MSFPRLLPGFLLLWLVAGCGAGQDSPSPEVAASGGVEPSAGAEAGVRSLAPEKASASGESYDDFMLAYYDFLEKVYGVLASARDADSAAAATARLDAMKPELRDLIRRGEVHGTWRKATSASGFSPLVFNARNNLLPSRDLMFREVEINNAVARTVLGWSTKLSLMGQMEKAADAFFVLEPMAERGL